MKKRQGMDSYRTQVVIIGAGFGGLQVVRGLARSPVDILLLDRNNYHGFWPLLYQVATAGLEGNQIAYPIRALVRRIPNARFRVANVQRIDLPQQTVITEVGTFAYDELVIAAGSSTNFFGMQEIEAASFTLLDVPGALALRNHIVSCFEQAMATEDPERRRQLLTFVVVGGGPTGVELAGAISELIRYVLRKDYPTLDFGLVRVLLLEATDSLISAFPVSLRRKAQASLIKMGVEVLLNAVVIGYANETLLLKAGATIPTKSLIWAAGVLASPLTETLGITLQRGGRIPVTPELQVQGYANVWAIGDLAYLAGPDGKPYPGLATVAMQQGRHVADNLQRKLRGQALKPFRYTDKGKMATIGRRSAVAQIWGMRWSGAIAWWIWLIVHVIYLAGIQNRIIVLINWAYNYLTYDRTARAIITMAPEAGQGLTDETPPSAPLPVVDQAEQRHLQP